MVICFNDILYSFAYALDCVEKDLVGVSTNHSNRVAFICALLGKKLNLSDEELTDLVACAILHDNALTEYIHSEYCVHKIDVLENIDLIDIGDHAAIGEKNIIGLPFYSDVSGAILYHHENADGSGPFNKTADQTCLFAQLIHIADHLDASFDLSNTTLEKYNEIITYITQNSNTIFSTFVAEIFVEEISFDTLLLLANNNLIELIKDIVPSKNVKLSYSQIISLSNFFAKIIDYKSRQTSNHSIQLAYKMKLMAEYYGYDELTITKAYLAGAVHDVGKLAVDLNILEKQGKLDETEYKHIQSHALITNKILSSIKGLEDISTWASSHHEKLNGTGYPFNKMGKDLGLFERVLCCLDIYQALTEERSYKKGMPHTEAMKILNNLALNQELDDKILRDIDIVFCQTKNLDYCFT